MENTIQIFLINLFAVIIMMFTGWLYSLKKNNVTIADSLWGLGFVIITWLTFIQSDGFIYRKILIATMVTLWGLRLFIHITRRNRGKGEDPRYTEWRKKHGDNFKYISLFKVFLIQALFQWMISFSQQFAQISGIPENLTHFDFIGLAIWISGFLIETFADLQLSSFIKNPDNKGKIMNKKLWRYSRHPNYFGESTMWWGIFITTLSIPYGYFTIISPMIITYTLLKITGVTLMEETIFGNNPEYKEYVRKTSSFIPWFPKK